MSAPHRLNAGGRIDRSAPLTFTFDGRTVSGFRGDTVASALLASGIRVVGRSFKYHRPRGHLSHGSDEPNALVQVDRGRGRIDPNNRTTVVEAIEGLVTRSQNRWPSLAFDLGSVNRVLSPLLAAGFYYKTFMWPRGFWDRVYEPAIRAAAGLGRAPSCPDEDRYVHRHAHCDVLVVGAGPAGLAAALAASKAGEKVMLVDEQAELGGSLLHELCATIDAMPASTWLAESVETLRGRPAVTLLSRTTAFGYYNHNHIGLIERVSDHRPCADSRLPRERLWQVRAKRVVIATGALERPMLFRNNDLPGVMLAESIRVYINRYGVAPGRRIVFATNGASAYQAAIDAQRVGLDAIVVDSRDEDACGPELSAARSEGIQVWTGQIVVAGTGSNAVRSVVVAPTAYDGRREKLRRIDCDAVGMSSGWTPAVHLFSQSRGKLRFDDRIDAFVPHHSAQSEVSVGAAAGAYDLPDCLSQGWRAGAGGNSTYVPREIVATQSFVGSRPTVSAHDERRPKGCFVDFQNDVTSRDIQLAVREGFTSVEHVKRYTTTGMATDQGKTSNINAIEVLACELGRPKQDVGTTTFRPPYTPVTFGAIAGLSRGELFDPLRTTPIDRWADARGAVFENVSLWRRARYFPVGRETMHEAVSRECRAVRSAVGIFDASTLGKIEVVGPDSAEFLNRMYVNAWTKLGVGKCRYGLMLKEDGFVFDDGVVARVALDRFHVTTTTGGAPRVLAHMEEYLQTEWPDLRVYLTSTTEQWAVIAVQGPRARDLIAPLTNGIEMNAEAFPHMTMRVGEICGVPTRLFRVSFTGELGYEINVPSGEAQRIWDAIWARGPEFDLCPYGTEAMHVLRAERGFIIVGQDTDGTVTPDDLGLGGMIAKTKRDFVGRRSLLREDILRADRKQLVGLLPDRPDLVLEEGAQVVSERTHASPIRSLGHVTSSYWSDACGRSIALALVEGGRARIGEQLLVTNSAGFGSARVVEPCFFDPTGGRAHA